MSCEQSQATRPSKSQLLDVKAESAFQPHTTGRSSTTSSTSSGGWLELTQTPRDGTSSVSSTSTAFLPLTATTRPAAPRNVTEEERRLFLLRARNGN